MNTGESVLRDRVQHREEGVLGEASDRWLSQMATKAFLVVAVLLFILVVFFQPISRGVTWVGRAAFYGGPFATAAGLYDRIEIGMTPSQVNHLLQKMPAVDDVEMISRITIIDEGGVLYEKKVVIRRDNTASFFLRGNETVECSVSTSYKYDELTAFSRKGF